MDIVKINQQQKDTPVPFDQIPSQVSIHAEPPVTPTVADELEQCQQLIEERTTRCRPIRPLYERRQKPPLPFRYKFFCVCPRNNPMPGGKYWCHHSDNVIIDRDVLTKEEHICYLATPKVAFTQHGLPAPVKRPYFYHKRITLPGCTWRIATLARPKEYKVVETLETFRPVLRRRQYRALRRLLAKKPQVRYTSIKLAMAYINEENRLKRIARAVEIKRCKRLRRNIKKRQQSQMKKIICVLFEEMRHFLLDDQFKQDESSPLTAVLLEQIQAFTDREFYTTSNLREYQRVLASNLCVWINKFITNLNVHVAPPAARAVEHPQMDTFLPLDDYISVTEELGEEEDYYEDYLMPDEEDFGYYGEDDAEPVEDA